MAKKKNKKKNSNAIYGGVMNFQSVFKDFYSDKNKSDDQKIMKTAFQGNFVQTALNAQVAQSQAAQEGKISKDQMKFAADLEQRNTLDAMKQEFKYGTQQQANEFKLQNKFADSEYKRDLGVLAATGEQERKNYQSQGLQTRLNEITKGEQQRLTDTSKIETEGREQRLTDTNKITTQGAEQRLTDTNKITTEGEQQRLTDTNKITTEGTETRLTRVTEGEQQRLTDTNKITNEGEQQRLTDTNKIRTEGDEERTTIDFSDQIEGRKEARRRSAARSLSRAS